MTKRIDIDATLSEFFDSIKGEKETWEKADQQEELIEEFMKKIGVDDYVVCGVCDDHSKILVVAPPRSTKITVMGLVQFLHKRFNS